LYGLLANNPRSGFEFAIDNTLPKQLFREEFIASANEDLWKKPRAQLLYQQLYAKGLQPILDKDRYHRFYYSAQRYVDENIMRVWQYLKQSNAYDNTIVMFLSDHGDMLGSHGGQFQKWYNAYEESIHVPFMVSNPQKRVINNNAGGNRGGIVRRHKSVHQLTSHIDILPTILGLAGIDQEAIRHQLLAEFQYALPLPGNDLSSIVCAKRPPKVHEHCQSVYFYTEDDPFSGENQVNFLCESYQSVASPNHVEAIIANFDEKFWKLTHYYGDRCGENQSYGSGVVEELYDLDEDPEELYNLTLVKRAKQVKTYLVDLLYRYSFQYRGATQTPPNLRLPSV
jgi:choline-sulfatase